VSGDNATSDKETRVRRVRLALDRLHRELASDLRYGAGVHRIAASWQTVRIRATQALQYCRQDIANGNSRGPGGKHDEREHL
jgi:hypothetical protein